jgi:hypothetical protein
MDLLRFLSFALCAWILIGCTSPSNAQSQPVTAGVLDARSLDLATKKVALTGEWIFFEDELLSPQACQAKSPVYFRFPAPWNELRQSGQGYGTYYLKILPPSSASRLAIEIPQLYSSYSVWVNGKFLGNNGLPGTTKESSTPQWRPQVLAFDNPGDTVHLVMQMSNFHHHLGGARDPLFLGTEQELTGQFNRAITSTSVESGILFLTGLVSMIILYLFRDRKKVIVYFCLLCFSWAIRALFSNLYVFMQMVPDFNWTIMVKIEYITLFLTMIWGVLFICRLFPQEENKIVKYLLVTGNIFFIGFAVIASPVVFTRWLPAYLIFCAAVLLYGVWVVIRALINERAGVWYLVTSILLALLLFGLDVTAYQGAITYKPMLFSLGYILIFLLLAVAMLYHLNIFKSKNASSMLTFDDLYKNQ